MNLRPKASARLNQYMDQLPRYEALLDAMATLDVPPEKQNFEQKIKEQACLLS